MYTVEWVESAENQLAENWMSAPPVLRKAITAACDQLDQDLAIDPLRESESRGSNKYIAFFPPLAVTFHLDEANRSVIISNLKVYTKRPKK